MAGDQSKESSLRAFAAVDLLSELADPVFKLDRDLRFEYLNPAFESISGLEAERALGKTLPELYPGIEGTHVIETYRRVLATGDAETFEAFWPRLDDWFIVRATPSGSGVLVHGYVGEKNDNYRSQLEASEERFRLLSQVSNDAIYDWNIDEGTVWWSSRFTELTGYEREAVPTGLDSWSRLLHPDDEGRVVASLDDSIESDDREWTCTYRIVRADGRVVDVLDRGHIVRNRAGRAVRMIGGMTDETLRKQNDERVLRAQRIESVGRLTSGIAHDINNVLAPIMITASILLEDVDPSDHHLRSDLENIRTSAERGATMIRRLLAYARGSSDQRTLVDPGPVVLEALNLVRETFPKTISLENEFADEIWPICSEPTQIHQIVTNLAINARDAMPDGGRLQVSIRNHELKAKGGPGNRKGRFVAITVSDEGHGMSKETLDRVFEPFFTTKQMHQGTGLGLPSVKLIVDNHEGFLEIETEVDGGTSVSVYLPACDFDEGRADAASEVDAPTAQGAGQLVLVVDDEEPVREAAARAMRRHGYEVLVADGVDSAVSLLAEHDDVELILTDVLMPHADGFDLYEAVRGITRAHVLAWTGLIGSEPASKLRASGVTVLQKPVPMSELLATVGEYLSDA